MNQSRDERRLTTILTADVVGYSRLMAANESETWAALKQHREELLDPKTVEYRGRTVKLMGDGVLMEFGSVVDAVLFAVDVQRSMAARNADVPEGRQIVFRIGINIGDIIVAGDDIYGDGVNVASRLEALAKPGGICISRNVYSQVRNKVDFGFNDLGEQNVKNIPEAISTFEVWWGPEMTTAPEAPSKSKRAFTSRTVGAFIGSIFLVVAIGVWVLYSHEPTRSVEPASLEKMAFPLPENPSIALLTFNTRQLDLSNQFLATSLPDTVAAEISRMESLFVIAPDSSLRFSSDDAEFRKAAEGLGVNFVLGGRITQEDNDLTIIVDLIDALEGKQLWRQTFEGGIEEIYEFRNDVVDRVYATLTNSSIPANDDVTRGQSGGPNRSSFISLLKGIHHFRQYTIDDNREAAQHFKKAIEEDSNFALAHAWFAWNDAIGVMNGWNKSTGEQMRRIFAAAKKSISLNSSQELGYLGLGAAFMISGGEQSAAEQFRQGLEINPDDPSLLTQLAKSLAVQNSTTEAVEVSHRVLRKNPEPPDWVYWNLGVTYFFAERYEDSIAIFKRSSQRSIEAELYLIGGYLRTGRIPEAEAQINELLERDPAFHLAKYAAQLSLGELKDESSLMNDLFEAGLPENVSFGCMLSPTIENCR